MPGQAGTPGYLASFSALVNASPGATATSDLHRSMTRADLAARAGGVQRLIRDSDVAVVAIIAGDVHELSAAGLGALAAGRTVAPMDWRQGPERLRASLAEVGAELVLVGDRLPDVTRALPPGMTTDLRTLDDAAFSPQPVDLDSPAILVHSSGSTGRPKVLPRSHHAVQQGIDLPSRLPIGVGDRFGTLLGATGSIFNRILAALVQDASIHCLDARSATSSALIEGFRAQGVTVLSLVPTYLRRLLDVTAEGIALPDLRALISVGEALEWDDVAKVRTRFNPRVRIVNRYGSSDAAPVSVRVIEPDEPCAEGAVPVGRPHPGTTVHLLDASGRPVPAGATGEIVVDSPMRREVPVRTDLPDGRVRYRTGDLGRIRSDGDLEVLGRIDRAVKVGGTRVEPAHIESVLRRLMWVEDALVLPVADPDGGTALVAHVVGSPTADELGPELDDWLRSSLHTREVPRELVVHPTGFPTLVSGKVDAQLVPTRGQGDDVIVRPLR